jgi:molybdate transport system substrate-binding protein
VTRRAAATLLAGITLLAAGGCGDDAGNTSEARLIVSAAASLDPAFTAYAPDFDAARVRYSFAGSDELAAQIRKGVRPDVFAAANTKLPAALYAEGLVRRPVVFARNRLVIAVPRDSDVASIDDLRKAGTKLAIGAAGAPVGDYTRSVLDRLPAADSKAILTNVRSEEPDVKGVVGKLTQGAADAGFVYVTDVKAANGRLRAIELPAALAPKVRYGVAVVAGAKEPAAAREFIAGLLSGPGRAALKAAGFESPPGR